MRIAVTFVVVVLGMSVAGSHGFDVIPTQDASLESNEADFPHNGSTASVWTNNSGDIWRPVEYYDLSALAGSTITSASYTFRFKDAVGAAPPYPLVEVYPILASEWGWSESSVKWNDFADKYDPCDLLFSTQIPNTEVIGDIVTLTIPPEVIQDWIDNPLTNAGWMWKLPDAVEQGGDAAGVEWRSKEFGEPNLPRLTLEGDIIVAEPHEPNIFVIADRDNYLKEKAPLLNYGVNPGAGAFVNDSLQKFRTAMSFDLTPYAGYIVTGDATLSVHLTLQRGGIVAFYRVLDDYADWSEGKSAGGAKLGPYNDWFEGTQWNNMHDRFDANSAPIAMANWSGANVGDTATVTIPASVVQEWIDGVNSGLIVKLMDEGQADKGYEFYTRDNLDPNLHPPQLGFDAELSPIGVVVGTDRSTYLSEAEPNVPQGNDNTSLVLIDPNIYGEFRYRSMLSFDLTPYAGSYVVSDGSMRLSLVTHYGRNEPIEFYSVDALKAGWDPTGVTWEDNANDFIGVPIVTGDLSWVTRLRAGAVKIPASMIQGWVDGVNPGLFLKLQNEVADPDPDGNPIGYGYTNVEITDYVDEFEVVDLISPVLLSFLAAPPGDANLDGKVNVDDLRIVALNWLQSGKAWTSGDFSGDGNVNLTDVAIMAGNWLYGVP